MHPNQRLAGRYRLVERIGAGGMGEVWRAEDITLERAVAIKALHPAMADDADFRQRFLREARTVAALNVPGIVAMFDSGEETAPDGSILSYLVMEFVVGRPLLDYVPAAESLSPNEVMGLVIQVARSLDAAHHVGIIHRDIKSANILVNKSGDATIVDFGIARRSGESGLTTTGSIMGTTEYAAPEQLRDEPLTPASDVYSLGVVAYECLAGARPFDGQSVAAVVAGHLNHAPPALPPSVPVPIARVVMRALAKDPRDRYSTAADFARACHEAVSAPASHRTRALPKSPAVRPPAAPSTAPSTVPSHDPQSTTAAPKRGRGRVLTALAGIAVLAVAAAIGVMLFTMDPDSGQASPSEGTGTPDDTPSEDDTPNKPANSVMVSADSGQCLLLSKLDGSRTALSSKMGLCEGSKYEVYSFDDVDDGVVTITFTDVYAGDESTYCVSARNRSQGLVADPDCNAAIAWSFKYLRSSGGVDFWQIRSIANDGLCLQAGADTGDSATAHPCDDGVSQQWRTEADA